jgi:hypothetical protein
VRSSGHAGPFGGEANPERQQVVLFRLLPLRRVGVLSIAAAVRETASKSEIVKWQIARHVGLVRARCVVF